MNTQILKNTLVAAVCVALAACSNKDERRKPVAAVKQPKVVSSGKNAPATTTLPAAATPAEQNAAAAVEQANAEQAPQFVKIDAAELLKTFNEKQADGTPSARFGDLIKQMHDNEKIDGGKTANLETIVSLALLATGDLPKSSNEMTEKSRRVNDAYNSIVATHFFNNDLNAEKAWLESAQKFAKEQIEFANAKVKASDEQSIELAKQVADAQKSLNDFDVESLATVKEAMASLKSKQDELAAKNDVTEDERKALEEQALAVEAQVTAADAKKAEILASIENLEKSVLANQEEVQNWTTRSEQFQYISRLFDVRLEGVTQAIAKAEAEAKAAAEKAAADEAAKKAAEQPAPAPKTEEAAPAAPASNGKPQVEVAPTATPTEEATPAE